jgi:hypothetical protein
LLLVRLLVVARVPVCAFVVERFAAVFFLEVVFRVD